MDNMYGGEKHKITPENVFLEYNYMQAVMDGIIRQVDFKISRADRIATDIQGACLFDRVSEMSKQKIYNQIMEICNGTFHKRVLFGAEVSKPLRNGINTSFLKVYTMISKLLSIILICRKIKAKKHLMPFVLPNLILS